MEALLSVKFLSPLKTYFNGKARYVASQNVSGPFSIFPGHAQFITLIDKFPLSIVDETGRPLVFSDENTLVLYSAADRVVIFSKSQQLKQSP